MSTRKVETAVRRLIREAGPLSPGQQVHAGVALALARNLDQGGGSTSPGLARELRAAIAAVTGQPAGPVVPAGAGAADDVSGEPLIGGWLPRVVAEELIAADLTGNMQHTIENGADPELVAAFILANTTNRPPYIIKYLPAGTDEPGAAE